MDSGELEGICGWKRYVVFVPGHLATSRVVTSRQHVTTYNDLNWLLSMVIDAIRRLSRLTTGQRYSTHIDESDEPEKTGVTGGYVRL
ncbi:hypothetical protein SCLCIDRAFT_1214274 [Scleroderma citrinum Foug A]|uniref:Uncharacterized protein n=1 Tax=Scleroderma citrinum Foug A TaxID=1036808 RepID=A0A0C3DRW5_9AGAM|nr:hypothetical protein SCLCIDRAFT_1214274 [Scleroderma citrinum Foug A]